MGSLGIKLTLPKVSEQPPKGEALAVAAADGSADQAEQQGLAVPVADEGFDAGIPTSFQHVMWEMDDTPEVCTSGLDGLLVPNGLGAFQGMTVKEQVSHALTLDHPRRDLPQLHPKAMVQVCHMRIRSCYAKGQNLASTESSANSLPAT